MSVITKNVAVVEDVTPEVRADLEEICTMCANTCGCAYDRGLDPEHCPLLATNH